jgi:hypothetical protein
MHKLQSSCESLPKKKQTRIKSGYGFLCDSDFASLWAVWKFQFAAHGEGWIDPLTESSFCKKPWLLYLQMPSSLGSTAPRSSDNPLFSPLLVVLCCKFVALLRFSPPVFPLALHVKDAYALHVDGAEHASSASFCIRKFVLLCIVVRIALHYG